MYFAQGCFIFVLAAFVFCSWCIHFLFLLRSVVLTFNSAMADQIESNIKLENRKIKIENENSKTKNENTKMKHRNLLTELNFSTI